MFDENVKCPKCGDKRKEAVKYTWWGGVIGPKVLNHVMCLGCGHKYNGKTGQDNTQGIVIYSIVVGVIVLAISAGVIIALNS
jgi:rubredoxin